MPDQYEQFSPVLPRNPGASCIMGQSTRSIAGLCKMSAIHFLLNYSTLHWVCEVHKCLNFVPCSTHARFPHFTSHKLAHTLWIQKSVAGGQGNETWKHIHGYHFVMSYRTLCSLDFCTVHPMYSEVVEHSWQIWCRITFSFFFFVSERCNQMWQIQLSHQQALSFRLSRCVKNTHFSGN